MKKNKLKKLFICLFSFLFIASATVAGGVLLSGSSYSVPASEDSEEDIQNGENSESYDSNTTSNATEPTNDDSWANHYADSFAGGTGSESDPYQIETAEQLSLLAVNVNNGTNYSGVYFLQTSNIDLSAYWWDAIGSSTSIHFAGHYDGGGHTVSGVFTQAGSTDAYSYQGLFGYVRGASSTDQAEISNVGVIESNIQGYDYVGGIVGYAVYLDITNCYNTGSVTGSGYMVGGIAGYNYISTVIDSYNTGDVESTAATGQNSHAGGVVGYQYGGEITNSYNIGNVTGSRESVGGVAGFFYSGETTDCYNEGSVTGRDNNVGGIVGERSDNEVINSYNAGAVTGSGDYVGGIVGYGGGSISNSYNTGTVIGNSDYVGGIAGNYGTISNSYNTGPVIGFGNNVGGIAGGGNPYAYITISNSYNTGTVKGIQYVGGIVGNYSSSNGGEITNSYNAGDVTATSDYVGGLVGHIDANTTIYNCYNKGAISGNATVGGCIGFIVEGDPTTNYVYNVFSIGEVTASTTSYIGGAVGRNQYDSGAYLYRCYSGGECSLGALGNSTSSLNRTDPSYYVTYTSNLSSASSTSTFVQNASNWDSTYPWDFETVWAVSEFVNDGYPFLLGVGVGANIPNNFDLMWTDDEVTTRDTDFEGSGTESDPYLISSAEELAGLAYMTNISTSTTYNNNDVYYLQTADIDVSAYWWDAIGTSTSSTYYFQGHYDGDGYTVSGVYTPEGSDTNYSYQGLFGYVYGASTTNRAEISNVGVIDSNIQGYAYVGGIAGRARYTNITNCYNTGSVTGSSSYVGGVVGYNYKATVSNSYNTGTVTSSGGNVGGVVGYNSSSTVSNSYNTGDVTSTYTGTNGNVGGVAGYNSSSITNSYNMGDVTASSQRVGGVVGYNYGSSARVNNTYNTGSVSGTSYVGGVVGRNYNGADVYNSFNTGSVTGTASAYIGAIVGRNHLNSPSVYNCYWGIDCTQTSAYGYNDGTVANCSRFENDSDPKTYVFFQDSTNWESSYPWDFETVWAFDGTNDGYPVLRDVKILRINTISAGQITPTIDITSSYGEYSNGIFSTTRDESVSINFINSNSDMNVYIAFNEEPTTESALNNATYSWDLTNGELLNVYVYQRRVVTYHSNNANNESVSYEYIGNETITSFSNPFVENGYHFINWNTNSGGTGTNYSQNVNITSSFDYDLDLYAQWSGNVYDVVFNHGNGTNTTYFLKYGTGFYETDPGDNLAGDPLENISPIIRDGYIFHGYFTGENGTGEQIIDENWNIVGSNTFTLENTTIYAYWTLNSHIVYFNTNGGSPVSNMEVVYGLAYGDLPSPTKANYEFVGWYLNPSFAGEAITSTTIVTQNTDHTLYAQWRGVIYDITLSHENGSTSTTIYQRYDTGFYSNSEATTEITSITSFMSLPTRDGYSFSGYYTSENGQGDQVIDEEGNIVVSNTFFTGNTTIYAYWEANVPAYYDETGGYWYIEYGKMPQTKLDSSVETDRIIINALDGDSPLIDEDGVVNSENSYYFAGTILLAKIYEGEEYCNYFGNWYRVEPVRWILDTDATSSESGYVSTDTLAVMGSVVYIGRYSNTSLGLGDGYETGDDFSFIDYYYNNFLPTEREYLVEFSAESETFSSNALPTVTTSTNNIFLSSSEEIESVIGTYSTEFSDLVKDYLLTIEESDYYFVRDLGSSLNRVICYTPEGVEGEQNPTSYLGMRFTIQVSEYVYM